MTKPLIFSYDIGHSSIGWAVTSESNVLGCGSVTFPADDCLASERRVFRRQRRHIRATRQRISRIAKLLHHLEVLSPDETAARGNSSPFLDAAEVLNGVRKLTWPELWNVLRWYAHNRGYDGNQRWKHGSETENPEDTEKLKNASHLMQKHGTTTMAETVVAALGLQVGGKARSSTLAYKTLDVAFPRNVVIQEVRALLEGHLGALPKLDQNLIDTLIAPTSAEDSPAWATIPVKGISLPKRYRGGLLCGQLIPRFDNRIINRCPYSGGKVPQKACMEFYQYRWARIVANIRISGNPLEAPIRQKLNEIMCRHGYLTKKQLIQEVETLTESHDHNLRAYFGVHPEDADSLVLDPARALAAKGDNKRAKLYPFWQCLSNDTKRLAEFRWRKGRRVDLNWMIQTQKKTGADTKPLQEVIEEAWEKDQSRKNPRYLTRGHLLNLFFLPDGASGRAPCSRGVMRETVEFVFSTNRDPSERGGPLDSALRVKHDQKKSIDDLTNNHLVRHRLKILERLAADMVVEYANGDSSRVKGAVVEVTSDLREYSGMTAKEIEGELKGRLKHFDAAIRTLKKNAPNLPLNGSLIRKCRIAMDQNWRCPFTGSKFDPCDLPSMEREHIIPRSIMPTDAMYALALTFPEVNRMKGQRTARQFIEEEGSNQVVGREQLSILPSKPYEALVEKMSETGHKQDKARQKKRKQLLLIRSMKEQEVRFTESSLTQTSQLVRLAARQLTQNLKLEAHEVMSMPGQVTAEIRKSWKLMGCLGRPDVCGDEVMETVEEPDKQGEIRTIKRLKSKRELRDITHLHHAVDAVTLGLAHFYLPKNSTWKQQAQPGALWRAMVVSHPNPEQKALLEKSPLFRAHADTKGRKRYTLRDIPQEVKKEVGDRLAERRVVQHVPTDMHGVKAERTTWRVVKANGDPANPSTNVTIRQKAIRDYRDIEDDGGVTSRIRIRDTKEKTEKAGKLLGLNPKGGKGKLKDLKGILIIGTNYGVALDPEPEVIPFHNVWHRIQELRRKNGGVPPRILRNGMRIEIPKGESRLQRDYAGIWKVVSIKNNTSGIALDMVRPHFKKPRNGVPWAGMNKSLKTLLEANSILLQTRYTGHSVK